jgi:hypothetical protein
LPHQKSKSILTKIWIIYSYPCGKRLKPILGEAVARLKGFGEISIDRDTEGRLSKISASTIDFRKRVSLTKVRNENYNF